MMKEVRLNGLWLVNDDFLKVPIPEKSVDLIVTSPPYNVGIKYDSFNDSIPYDQYLEFTRQWLKKAYKLVKYDGRMCVNVPLEKKGRSGHDALYVDFVNIAREVGWKYRLTIVWNKQKLAKRTAWGSWLSPKTIEITAPVEVIIVFYRKKWSKTSGSQKSDITRQEFIDWTVGLWNFPGESKVQEHPAPFPLELPKRCIKLFSYVGDTILDPFMGSGTTMVACALLDRKGIGVEISGKYFEFAVNRVKKYALQNKLTRWVG